jgi:lipopolysaccharide heptosyltransferase I
LTRFLIVRLGALGDIVHAVPVAAALRRRFPDARIDWVVSAKHGAILDLLPIIDRRLVIDGNGAAGILRVVPELRRTRYDVAFDVQGLIKSAMIARLSGAKRVVGFSSRYLREPFAGWFYTEAYDPGGAGMYATTEPRHVVRINLGLLSVVGIQETAIECPFERAESAAARQIRTEAGDRYAVLNPGAAWPNKRWPPDRLARVASALYERHRLRSVVIWGPDERQLADAVVTGAGGAAVAAPPTSIADLFAVVRGAAIMVSGDTGPTHMAAAVGTPVVGIYGPTRPERNGPWRAEDVTVSRARDCRCHHLRRCTQPRMCLLDIEVQEVIDAVERRLAADTTHG